MLLQALTKLPVLGSIVWAQHSDLDHPSKQIYYDASDTNENNWFSEPLTGFRRFFHEMRACGVIQEMTLEAPGHDQMCLGGPREGRGGLK